jgi:hypothetical protein
VRTSFTFSQALIALLVTASSRGFAEPTKEVQPAQPAKSAISVRHLDKKTDGFTVAETPHFRILHDQDKPIVEKVGETAEKTRARLQKKWFGAEAVDWDGKCSIYLHQNREKYSAKTKMKNTLGHMRTIEWGGAFLRSIHLPCKEPNLVEDVLPHEVSHSVMAIRFQGRTPRWADEGMAMLAESNPSIKECVGKLPWYRKNDGLFATEILLQTREVQKGAEPALKQYYDIQNFADLDSRWQVFAFPGK